MASLGSSVGRAANTATLGSSAGSFARAARTPAGTPIVTTGPGIGTPPSGYVRFQTAQAPFVTIDVQTTGEASVPAADGGWETISRPGRIDATVWRSGKPLRQDIPITMDVLAAAVDDSSLSVDDEWHALEKLWRPAGGAQPPILNIAGPVQHADRPWIISDLVAEQDTVKRLGTRLVRVRATVSLMQFVTPDLADYADPDTASTKALVDRPQFETSKAGDTIKTVADRRLGKKSLYTEIKALYPGSSAPAWIKNPNATIPTGTQVQVPNG